MCFLFFIQSGGCLLKWLVNNKQIIKSIVCLCEIYFANATWFILKFMFQNSNKGIIKQSPIKKIWYVFGCFKWLWIVCICFVSSKNAYQHEASGQLALLSNCEKRTFWSPHAKDIFIFEYKIGSTPYIFAARIAQTVSARNLLFTVGVSSSPNSIEESFFFIFFLAIFNWWRFPILLNSALIPSFEFNYLFRFITSLQTITYYFYQIWFQRIVLRLMGL